MSTCSHDSPRRPRRSRRRPRLRPQVEIDASSIDTNEPVRDAYLRSGDFFGIAEPTIGFRSTAVRPDEVNASGRSTATSPPAAGRETAMSKPKVRTRRVYDDPSPEDGRRVLVDRIWPRGLAKARAGIDEWAREVAPSTELRRWYGHEPARFEEFRRRYQAELAEPQRQAAVRHLLELARSGPLTLMTATRDVDHSQAAVLVEHLRNAR